MSFFQNVFPNDFEGNWLLSDWKYVPKWVCPRNAGRGDELVVAWNTGPYDLSGVDESGNRTPNLVLCYALWERRHWASLTVNISGAVPAATTAEEVVDNLNADATFAERFEARYEPYQDSTVRRVIIRQRRPITDFWFYVPSGQAESVLQFNRRAGVAELPTYFDRHTIVNRFAFDDAQNHLIYLNPAVGVDAAIIDNAVDAYGRSKGFVSTTVQDDWQLLAGKSGAFNFQHGPGTSTVSTTTTLIYPAGAVAGDLAKQIVTRWDGSTPPLIHEQYEIPYTLTAGDLITPP